MNKSSHHSQSRIQNFPVEVAKREQKANIWPSFPENCMKMKKIVPKLCTKFVYVDPSLTFWTAAISISSATVNGLKLGPLPTWVQPGKDILSDYDF